MSKRPTRQLETKARGLIPPAPARGHERTENMKHFTIEADAGSVLIGNDTMRYQVPNGYGDGLVDVYTYVSRADMESLKNIHNVDQWELQGVTHGTTYIYPYDCLCNHGSELIPEIPVAALEGRYGIYSGKGFGMARGLVIFEDWS